MEKILLPESLTAENGAKALLMGEFHETIHLLCCDGDDKSCDYCDGHTGSYQIDVTVSWTTIKEIYKKIVEHYRDQK